LWWLLVVEVDMMEAVVAALEGLELGQYSE
jgi:hypothetical protein